MDWYVRPRSQQQQNSLSTTIAGCRQHAFYEDHRVGTSGDNSLSCLGFVTVVESPPHGLFGGYLVLDAAGRPLEFHCTAPVKSNRVQKILYGSTLEPFLYGELIAKTLLTSSTLRPDAVLTDQQAVLAVRSQVELPVVYLQPEREMDAPHTRKDGQKISAGGSKLSAPAEKVQIPGYLFEVPTECSADVLGRLRETVAHLDLVEPFDRIREAINEAQRIGHATRDVA